MKKSELLELWKGIPGDAEIYVESDHGQIPEQAYGIEVTFDDEISYYGEDNSWKEIKPSTDLSKVTAIRIR